MKTVVNDLTASKPVKLIAFNPFYVASTTSWVDAVPELSAIVSSVSGLLVCDVSGNLTISGTLPFTVFWRWLIDGVAPDTSDAHSSVTKSVAGTTAQIFICRASMQVGAGLHRVSLQARASAAGGEATVDALPLIATIDCR
jgi:hypothetical protein